MESPQTKRYKVTQQGSNGGEPAFSMPAFPSSRNSEALTSSESGGHEVNELIGRGSAPQGSGTETDFESTSSLFDPKHSPVSSPMQSVDPESEAGALDEADTETAYEEGWEEKPKTGTEAVGEEAEPVIEASFTTQAEGQQEFFGLLAAALPSLISFMKPLIQQAVPSVIGGLSSLLSPAFRRLPIAIQPTAKSLLEQLKKLGLNVKLESSEDGQAGDEAYGQAGSTGLEAAAMQMEALENIILSDDRIRVMDTAITPFKRVCHLSIRSADGKSFLGSGFFIGPRTILTAGHCVHMQGHGGWVKEITVTPGRNGSQRPFDSFKVTKFRSVRGWVDSQDTNYDYGVLIIDKSQAVNQNIGSFGFGYYPDADILNKNLNNAGYPGDKQPGTMWRNGRRAKAVNPRKIIYDIDTMPGQSGSPVWFYRVSDGRRIVVAIHTNGANTGNSGTRITKDVYNNLLTWRTEGGNTY